MNKGVVICGLVMWLGLSTFFLLLRVFELSLIVGFCGLIVTIAGFLMKGTSEKLPSPPALNQNQYPSPQMYNFQPNTPSNSALGHQAQGIQNQSTSFSEVDVISQIERWGNLKEKGLITEEEFQSKKDELLK